MRRVWSGKAAWRRLQGMAVRPHAPSAAAKQAAQDQAAYECAVLQQALQTRALADQCWELYELIDAWSRDPDMPRPVSAGRPPGLLAGASAHFYGVAAARVRRHRRALQRLAHVRPPRGAHAGALSDAGLDKARACVPIPLTTIAGRACERSVLERPPRVRCLLAQN